MSAREQAPLSFHALRALIVRMRMQQTIRGRFGLGRFEAVNVKQQ
jgi:hypothetical protein